MNQSLGIEKTVEIANYLKALFVGELRGEVEDVQMPHHWPLELLEECHYMVKLVLQAIENERRMEWSVAEYVQVLKQGGKGGRGVEEILLQKFPPHESGLLDIPCVIVDRDGVILLWYLPRILGRDQQGKLWNSVEIIESSLKIKMSSTSWRVNGQYFRSGDHCRYRPGTVSFALAWFQQGMSSVLDMEVAAELRRPAARNWITATRDTAALLGGLVGLMNPAMFDTGMSCVRQIAKSERVAKREGLEELLEVWTSPYTAVSLMHCRDSPDHRDRGGHYSSMDMLVSVGPYTSGLFEVPGLGLKFWYPSGTVITLLGRIVGHKATCHGERLCWAQYLKENVLSALGLAGPEWVTIQDLKEFVLNPE